MSDFPETNSAATAKANASVRAFNAELKAFAQKQAPEEVLKLYRKMALEGLRRLVLKTPVDTGRARGNWQVGVDKEPEKASSVTDKSGAVTIFKGQYLIDTMKLGTCYIVNNVEYIEVLEAGHSGQAPAGMLAVTVEELRGMF